ncbi:hypothetical protein [Streptomyces sp. ODS05-4]|uniref:hypothetical protein n=1 Tax=Streptomyces sp. ODS05-4 TaxID=2944939 RepID=UPI0027E57E6F|nr:hypothetical protein [Streptomyces sp. ODS05-4]
MSGQYVLTRTFYALSDARTPFLLNLVIVAVNVTLSTVAYTCLPPAGWSPGWPPPPPRRSPPASRSLPAPCAADSHRPRPAFRVWSAPPPRGRWHAPGSPRCPPPSAGWPPRTWCRGGRSSRWPAKRPPSPRCSPSCAGRCA